jgi:hypothetical protein
MSCNRLSILVDGDLSFGRCRIGTVNSDVYCALSALLGLFQTHQGLTLAIHVCIEIQLGDIVGRSSLEPNTLPDTTAGRVKDVTRAQGLLSNGNNIAAIICGIVDENKPVMWVRIYCSPLGSLLTVHSADQISNTASHPTQIGNNHHGGSPPVCH